MDGELPIGDLADVLSDEEVERIRDERTRRYEAYVRSLRGIDEE